nr:MAG TPA: hypothetical protein [Caudoviricetes sp.]
MRNNCSLQYIIISMIIIKRSVVMKWMVKCLILRY